MESLVDNIQREEASTTLHPKTHKHTIIWIHGLNQPNEQHLLDVYHSLNENSFNQTIKIVCPKAPNRYVTTMNKECSSWFDIKFRNELRFVVPFDQAFSSSEVEESYQKYPVAKVDTCFPSSREKAS